MSLINVNELPSFINTRGIETRKVLQRPEISMINLELKPGEKIESHKVDVHVTFVVLRGSGRIKIGEQVFEVVPHYVVLCDPGMPMELIGGEEGMSFLNIKTPNPAA